MAKLFVHHKVADYTHWRGVYDSMSDLRRSFGLTEQQVFSVSGNPNELVILTSWPSAEKARAFAASPELKQGLQKAGVLTQPEILVLEEAEDAQEVAQRVVQEIEAQDFVAARELLSDDFRFSGAVPVPIGPDEWLGVHRALAEGMPDIRFRYHATGGSGERAEGTVQVGGTHTATFHAPIPGVPPVPATGKKILNPQEHVAMTAQGGKLTSWVVENVPDGGVAGILKQMTNGG